MSSVSGSSRGGKQGGDRGPRIHLVPADPYLAFLIRSEFKDAEVTASEDLVGMEMNNTNIDILIVDLDVASPPEKGNLRVIGTVDSAHARRTGAAHGVGNVLLRPFLPSELYDLINGMDSGKPRTRLHRSRMIRFHWIGYLRLAAVSIAAVMQAASGAPGIRTVLLGIAFLYSGARLVPDVRDVRWMSALDVGLATIILAATGGVDSYYLGFGLVAALGNGVAFGWRWGTAGGLIISLSGLPSLATGVSSAPPPGFLTWVGLFPLMGVVGGLLATLARQGDPHGVALLSEANRVLSNLYSIARAMPGSLEIGSIVSSSTRRLKAALRAPAAAIQLRHDGGIEAGHSLGMKEELTDEDVEALIAGSSSGFSIIQGERVPVSMRYQPCWLVLPMGSVPNHLCLLVAACADHGEHEEHRTYMERLGEEIVVALDNAFLFARVRELSVDGERRRLAGDLHDGVAQALTHVRLELDHLAQTELSAEEMRGQAARLARVAGRALSDVRMAISGLRDATSKEGLVNLLRGYLRDFAKVEGPVVELLARGEPRLTPIEEAELFKIVQEAVSNAVRHARAKRVDVLVDATGMNLVVRVQDDGVGIKRQDPGTAGLGMRLMKERADRLGARFSIASVEGGGLTVEVILDRPKSDVAYAGGGRS